MKLVITVLLGMLVTKASALECAGETVKVTVKITDPSEFDEYERYLFQGLMAYSVRKYCGSNKCTSSQNNTDTGDVTLSNITDRFAMCVAVTDCNANLLTDAIKMAQPRFNGALVLTDETLVFDGIPPILTPKYNPDFPTWLIPFIVFVCLVVIAAIAIIGYSVYQTKKKPKVLKHDSDEDDELHVHETVYENGALAASSTHL